MNAGVITYQITVSLDPRNAIVGSYREFAQQRARLRQPYSDIYRTICGLRLDYVVEPIGQWVSWSMGVGNLRATGGAGRGARQ